MATNKSTRNTPCDCGCGGTTKGGRYLPGHDAKHKKALVEASRGGSKRAANRLEQLGWGKFLKTARAGSLQKTAPKRRTRKVAQPAS